MNLYRKILAGCVLSGLALNSWAQSATMEDVERSFHPYDFETPEVGELQPGVVVTAANVDTVAKGFLDEGIRNRIAKLIGVSGEHKLGTVKELAHSALLKFEA